MWCVTVRGALALALAALAVVCAPAAAGAGFLVAEWQAPTTSADGTPLQDLAGYRVYVGSTPPECPGDGYREFEAPAPSPASGDRAAAVVGGLTTGQTYWIRISAVDTSGNESACTAAVSGTARGTLSVTPGVNLGTVPVGETVERAFTVGNVGQESLTVHAGATGPFTLSPAGVFILAPGQSRTLTLRFSPTEIGHVAGAVTFAAAGESLTRLVSAQVVPGGSDLVIGAVSAPATGAVGGTLAVSTTVRNQAGPAAGAFRVGIYMALTDNTPGGGTLVGFRQVAGLAAGASSTATTTITIPGNFSAGQYFLSAVADIDDEVDEAVEANNGRTATGRVTVGPVDLQVSAVGSPAIVAPGATLAVSSSVRNTGTAVAGAFRVGLYLSANQSAPGTLVGSRAVASLGGGAVSTATTSVTIPVGTIPGPYFVSAVADDLAQVVEQNEDNNRLAAATAVTVGADLRVTAVTAPATGAAGRTIAVSSTVRNFGAAATAFRVGIFLSTSNVPGSGTQIGFRDVSSLAAGGTATASVTVTIPAATAAGSYYVSAVADINDAVPETDEANNGLATAATTTVSRPDLVVTAVTVPATAGTGGTMAVAHTVRNAGATGTVAGPFRVGIFISSASDLPGVGTLVGFRDVTTLAGGGVSTVTTTVTIPASTPAGDYYVSVVADINDVSPEGDDANNGRTAATTVSIARPDLVVTAVTFPATAGAGGTIAIPNAVRNQGPTATVAGLFRVGFYASPTDDAPGAGTLIGSRTLPRLAGGAVSSVTTTLLLPASLAAGPYFVSAVVDVDDTVPEGDETNNGRAAPAQMTIARPDLVVSAVAAPATAGVGGTLQVMSTVRNQGPTVTAAGTFRVGIYLSASDPAPGSGTLVGFRDVPTLIGGAASTATTTVTIPAALPAGPYSLSVVADINGVVPESDETNNGRTAATQVTVAGVDLLVTAVTAPTTAGAGGALAVSNTVRNSGAAGTQAGAFRIGIYLSLTNDTPGDGTLIGFRDVAGLAGGAVSTATTTVTVPPSTAPGQYYLSVVADVNLAVPETNDGNNGRFAPQRITVSRPDLIVTAVSAPATGGAGGTIVVPNTVQNTGPAGTTAAGFRVGIFLSTDQTPGTGVQIGFRDIAGLAGGASSTASTTVTIPPTTVAGTYYVSARADVNDVVPENSESNNELVAGTATTISRPDLTISALTPPTSAGIGGTIVVLNGVRNLAAPVTFAGPFRVGFYLTSSNTSAPGVGTQIGFRDLTGLAGGAASVVTSSLTIPASITPGTYFLSALADINGVVSESTTANNGLLAPTPIVIGGPDLLVTAASGPTTGGAGGTITLPNTVRNQGPAGTGTARFRVGVYLSATDTAGTGTLIGTREIAAGLAGGTTSAATTTVTIPPTTEAGAYFLSVKADIDDAVPEVDEINNAVSAGAITIGRSDLVVTTVTAPLSAGVGGSIVVPNTVANQGPAGTLAGAFRVGIYLSATDATPGAGTQVGFRNVTSLAGGAVSAATTAVTIPAGTAPGTYYLSARADVNEVVPESEEGNNGRTAATQITIGGIDLAVTAAAAPASGGAGGTIAIPHTVMSQGPAGTLAGTFRVGIYLSDSATPGSGTLMGFRNVTSLPGGVASVATTTVTIPANTSAGTYFVSVVADINNAVTEIDEDNNGLTAATQITVSRPDLAVTALTIPGVGGAGGTISVGHTVTNLAPASSVAGFSRVGFYLSSTNTSGSGTLIGVRDLGVLVGGTSSVGTATVTIPAVTAAGTYFVSAVADINGTVPESDEGNNGRIAATQLAVTQPDLVISALSAPASAAIGGSLSVAHTVLNQGAVGTAAGPFRIGFFLSSTNTSGSGTLVGFRDVAGLAGGATSSATTAVAIPANTSAGTYFLSARVDTEGAVPEANEDNNVWPALAVVVSLPDLVVAAVSAPLAGGAGGTIEVTNTIRNQGPSGTVTGAFRIGFFLSPSDSTPGAGTQIGLRDVAGLGGQANSQEATRITIPPETLPGTYFLSVVADIDGSLPESDEANNGLTAATTLTVIGPDLVVTAVTAPATGVVGGTMAVANTVVNQGAPGTVATAFRVGIYIAALDNTPGAGVLIGFRDVALLAAGASSVATSTVAIPADVVPGTYFVSALADVNGSVPEINDVNNGRTAGTQVTLVRPNLVVSSVTAPATAGAGGTTTVTTTVQNIGPTGAAVGAFRMGIYLSPDDNTPGAGVQIGFRDIPGLAGGASSSATTTVTVPASTVPGDYFLSAVADIGGAITEALESDNGRAAPTQVSVAGSDLIIASVVAPANGGAGGVIDVQTTVRNAGATGTVAAGFRIGFYLSLSEATPGAGVLIGFRDVLSLSAGPTGQTLTTQLTIPTNTSAGTYFLSAVADINGAVAEADEANNGLTSTTRVTVALPDLQMTALTVPASSFVGGAISVTSTVRNFGAPTTVAGAFLVRFFLSLDNTPGTGTAIATRLVSTLAGGAESTATANLPVPINLAPGTYYLTAVADANDSVLEGSEANNGRAAQNQIVIAGPDLVMTAVDHPASANATEFITVTTTVQNQGAGWSGGFAIGVYLSSTPTPNVSTDRIGDRLVNALPPGNTGNPLATSTGQTMVAIPLPTAPGTYYVTVIADRVGLPNGQVPEHDETNNRLTSGTQIEIGPAP